MRKGVISIEVLIVVVLAIIVLIVLGGYFVQKFRATTEQAEKPIESIEKQTCAYYNGGCYNSCDPSQQLKVPRPSSGRWIDCGLKECCVSLEKLKIPKTE
ncbi:hypothetical protein HYV79_01085, partial [Candidatus Woesearchaeota archaeon]|nr:hypothetical protein [Candidatus Woesearchaeota archaeon]